MRDCLLSFLLSLSWVFSSDAYSCKDINGNGVDWFIVYKPPNAPSSPEKGKKFLYVDNNSARWQKPEMDIGDHSSPVIATIRQLVPAINGNDNNTFFFMYNDQPPTETPGSANGIKGHAKGLLGYTPREGGFWMRHTVPKFPTMDSEDWYPMSGYSLGQSFICLSTSSDYLRIIGQQMLYMQAIHFRHNVHNLSDDFQNQHETYQILKNMVNATYTLSRDDSVNPSKEFILTRTKEWKFISYAKHADYGRDLWYDLIAKDLNVSMNVQTFLSGRSENLRSVCDGTVQVLNVQNISISNMWGSKFSFGSAKDHSKWSYCFDGFQKGTLCLGDLNRKESQNKRGGGAICFGNPVVSALYKTMAAATEKCPHSIKSNHLSVFEHVARSLSFISPLLQRMFRSSTFEIPASSENEFHEECVK